MLAKEKNLLPLCWHGLVEYLALFPFVLLIGVLIHRQEFIFPWLLSLYVLLTLTAIIRTLLKQKRVLSIVLASTIAVLLTILIGQSLFSYIGSFIVTIVVAFRGVQHGENEWEDILPSRFLWAIGLPSYFVAYLAFHYFASLTPFKGLLTIFGVSFIICLLFITNQQHLQRESLAKGKHKPNQDMKKINDLFIIITILFVLAITNLHIIQSALYNGTRSIIGFFIWFASLFSNEEEIIREEKQESSMTPMLPEEEPKDPSFFAELMEQIMIILGFVLIVFLLLLFLAIFIKKVRRAIKTVLLKLWQIITQVFSRRKTDEISTDYSDEKQSLFNWKDWRKTKQEEFQEAITRIVKRKPKFEQLSPAEKARFLYKEIATELKRQHKWRHSMTAHEVLQNAEQNEQLARLRELYDDARYGKDKLDKTMETELNSIWKTIK